MGKYRSCVMVILPNLMIRQMKALGDAFDPGRYMSESQKTQKIFELALNELFDRASAEVPELLAMKEESTRARVSKNMSEKAKILYRVQRMERHWQAERNIVRDIPIPLDYVRNKIEIERQEELRRIAKEIEEGRMSQEEADRLNQLTRRKKWATNRKKENKAKKMLAS